MAELGEVYDGARRQIDELVRGLDEAQAEKPVPATPGWSIKAVVSHLSGEIKDALAGRFPREFFQAFGQEDAVAELNTWTDDHVTERADVPIEEILTEWELNAKELIPFLNGEVPLPAGSPPFAEYVFITDVATHLHDIYGALDIQRGREDVPVKIAGTSFVTMMDVRMQQAGAPSLLLDAGTKQWTAGGGEPEASVKASRFEFFRALSGRRSPDQIRAYEWSTDPDPFLTFFYPYGPRTTPLEE